ncbi:hypothetical protein CWO90_08875 [Bradyrhizobium sp. Leo121]|nr:hypothetical protein CWO90_08875 [Bradyrhizobium sp. Leo121]
MSLEPDGPIEDADGLHDPVHGNRRGLMNTGIEIRQDLITDQAGQKAWADRLAWTLPRSKRR